MENFNFEDALYGIKDMLRDLVADYLDVNRGHIMIGNLYTQLVGEDCYDWDNDPEDACAGVQGETYYMFDYQYRKDKRTLDYEESKEMYWKHVDYEGRHRDEVMTQVEFDALFERKKADPCSLVWYEEPMDKETIAEG